MVFLLVIAGWTAWVLGTPSPTRPERLLLWTTVALAAGLVAWLWQRRATRIPGPDRPLAPSMTIALAVAATFLATATPVAAESVSLRGTEDFNPTERAAATERRLEIAARLHEVTGPDSTVTYLAFGDMAYFLRNPIDCRYPSPVFLQRSRTMHKQEGSRSWTETLACIQNTPGQWLVRDTSWFRLASQPREVTEVLTATFDCDRTIKVSTFWVCPRRSSCRRKLGGIDTPGRSDVLINRGRCPIPPPACRGTRPVRPEQWVKNVLVATAPWPPDGLSSLRC